MLTNKELEQLKPGEILLWDPENKNTGTYPTHPWGNPYFYATRKGNIQQEVYISWDTQTKLLYSAIFVKDNFSKLYISQLLL